ncbi:hypothetical protein ALC53_01614 [Atta colombica]|uniref:Uncharacterized protein n=1 Tax=Atta colombica TaxID=520822 RepID=A0A195BV29_9HYME|nr:hypothetical protein ALC53_01614 [Atta colombica]
MSSLEDAFAKFPPVVCSVPSRCCPKLHRKDYVCPKYFFDISPRPYGSAVQFQLTYTCDRMSYSPCYFPAIPYCHSPENALKILPPSSCVRFCVRYTNKESSYYPCYWSNLPKCLSSIY